MTIRVDKLGTLDVQFLQYHTADTQGHKMCLFNTQVVNHSENVLADNVKIVFRKFRKNVLAITVVPAGRSRANDNAA